MTWPWLTAAGWSEADSQKIQEWKVMNTLLIQDIYQQHQQRRTPRLPREIPQKPPSSARLENSIWENKPGCSPLLSYPSGNSSRRCESLTFFLAKENWNPVPGNTRSSWRDAVGMKTSDDEVPHQFQCSHQTGGMEFSWENSVCVPSGTPTMLGSRWDMQTILSVSCFLREGQHSTGKRSFWSGYFFIEIFRFPRRIYIFHLVGYFSSPNHLSGRMLSTEHLQQDRCIVEPKFLTFGPGWWCLSTMLRNAS